MLARVGLPLLRSNSNPSLDGDSSSSAASSSASRSTVSPGGPSPFPGERTLLPTPPPGTSDPMAFLVDDSLSDLQKQKKYCLSSLPLQQLLDVTSARLADASLEHVGVVLLKHFLAWLPRLSVDEQTELCTAVCSELKELRQPSAPLPRIDELHVYARCSYNTGGLPVQ